MDTRTFIIRKTVLLLAIEIVCAAAICGVFALLGRFGGSVLFGTIVGAIVAVANFFFMALAANHAADQAQAQNVKGGKSTIKMSYTLRLVVIFVVLFAFAKSGLCNVIAMIIPLALIRPIIMVTEFFRKEDKKQ